MARNHARVRSRSEAGAKQASARSGVCARFAAPSLCGRLQSIAGRKRSAWRVALAFGSATSFWRAVRFATRLFETHSNGLPIAPAYEYAFRLLLNRGSGEVRLLTGFQTHQRNSALPEGPFNRSNVEVLLSTSFQMPFQSRMAFRHSSGRVRLDTFRNVTV